MSKDYSKITKIGKCCGTCEYISNANAGVVKHCSKNNITVNIFTCCDDYVEKIDKNLKTRITMASTTNKRRTLAEYVNDGNLLVFKIKDVIKTFNSWYSKHQLDVYKEEDVKIAVITRYNNIVLLMVPADFSGPINARMDFPELNDKAVKILYSKIEKFLS